MGPEEKDKARVIRVLKAMGVWYYTVPRTRFGRAGVPDILAIYAGRFLAIEVKRFDGKGNYTITPTQEANLCMIARQGGHAICIDSLAKLNALAEDMLNWEAGLDV